MSDKIGRIFRYNKTAGKLVDALKRMKGTVDVSHYRDTLLEKCKTSVELYRFLSGNKNITDGGEPFRDTLEEKINSDPFYDLKLLENEVRDISDISPESELMKKWILPLEKGDIELWVDKWFVYNSDVAKWVSLLGDLLLEATVKFYKHTGSIQIFRFLIFLSKNQFPVTANLKKQFDIVMLPVEFLRSESPNYLLAYTAALPNTAIFFEMLKHATKEDVSGIDIKKGMKLLRLRKDVKLTDIFDYIAIAPISESEREDRYKSVLKKFPDLKNDLLTFEDSDLRNDKYKKLEVDEVTKLRKKIGFSSGNLLQSENKSYSFHSAAYLGLLSGKWLAKEFLTPFNNEKNKNKFVLSVLADALLYNPEVILNPENDFFKKDHLLSGLKGTLKRYPPQGLLHILFAFYLLVEKEKDTDYSIFFNYAVEGLRKHAKDSSLFEFNRHLLKLSILAKEPFFTELEWSNLCEYRACYDSGYINIYNSLLNKDEPEAASDISNQRVAYILVSLFSVALTMFCGFDPLILFRNQVSKIILMAGFSFCTLLSSYMAVYPPQTKAPSTKPSTAPEEIYVKNYDHKIDKSTCLLSI